MITRPLTTEPIKFNPDAHYLGSLCRKGHSHEDTDQSIRYKFNNACATCIRLVRRNLSPETKAKQKELQKKWRHNNLERVREHNANYLRNNHEAIKARDRQGYKNKFAKMTDAEYAAHLLKNRINFARRTIDKIELELCNPSITDKRRERISRQLPKVERRTQVLIAELQAMIPALRTKQQQRAAYTVASINNELQPSPTTRNGLESFQQWITRKGEEQ